MVPYWSMAAPDRRIVQPVVCRQRVRVDTHDDIRRPVRVRQVVAETDCERRETPVEADHERRSVAVLELGPDLRKLALGQAERFLDQDGLPGTERGERQLTVNVMTGGDHDASKRLVVDQLLDGAGAAPEAELLRGRHRRQPGGSRDSVQYETVSLRERNQLASREAACTDEPELGPRRK